jgi:hypothetical protein
VPELQKEVWHARGRRFDSAWLHHPVSYKRTVSLAQVFPTDISASCGNGERECRSLQRLLRLYVSSAPRLVNPLAVVFPMGAVTELERKRLDLKRELAAIEQDADIVRGQIKIVDSCIKLLGKSVEPQSAPVRPKRYRLFAQGEISRAVADIRREMPALKQPRAIAFEFMRRKALDASDFALWARLTQSVRGIMRKKERQA